MKKIILTAALLMGTVQASFALDAVITDETTEQKNVSYQDYSWDIGLVGGMIADGFSGDKRLPTSLGLHGAYHITNSVSVHAEYLEVFTVISQDDDNAKNTDRTIAASVAYDFSPERSYSLYAKGGIGYESLSNDNDSASDFVTLLGAGARYIFTDHVGGYVEGRWKYGFNESGNSLMGVIGIDYSFGNAN